MTPPFAVRGNLVPLVVWLLLFVLVSPCSGTKAPECELSAVYRKFYCPRDLDSSCFQGNLHSGNITVAINGSAQPLSTATATNVPTHDFHKFTVSLSSAQETGDSISNVAVRFRGPSLQRYNENYPGGPVTYASLNQCALDYEDISCDDEGCSIHDGNQWIPMSEIPCIYRLDRCSATKEGTMEVTTGKFIQCTRPVNNVSLYLHLETPYADLDWSFSGLSLEFEVEVNKSHGGLQIYRSIFPLEAVGKNGYYFFNSAWFLPCFFASACVAAVIAVSFGLGRISFRANGQKHSGYHFVDDGGDDAYVHMDNGNSSGGGSGAFDSDDNKPSVELKEK